MKKLLILTIVMSFTLSGCSEESKLYKEIKKAYDSSNWETTSELCEDFLELYPEDKRVEEINNIFADSEFQIDLDFAKGLSEQLSKYLEEKNWDKVEEICKEIQSIVPDTDVAKDTTTLVSEAMLEEIDSLVVEESWREIINLCSKVQVLSKGTDYSVKATSQANKAQEKLNEIELNEWFSDLEEYYSQENWNKVIEISSKITSKYANTEKGKIAREYKTNAEKTLKDIYEKELKSSLSSFEVDYDEVENNTFYMPDSIPTYVNTRSSFAVYIGVNDSYAWLRWRLSYTGDSWIFFESITVNVDGEKYTRSFDYYDDIVRDNEYGDVWEVADVEPTGLDFNLLKNIANSEKTIVRFQGDDYHYDYTVSKNDKEEIKKILKAFKLLLEGDYYNYKDYDLD